MALFGTQQMAFQVLARHLREGVLLLDGNGMVRYLNPTIERIFNMPVPAAAGCHAGELLQDMDLLNRAFNALAGMQGDTVECILGNEGNEYEVSFLPFLDEEEPRLFILFTDITEARQTERLQKNFIENVSHESRTPLTAVQGFAEALLGGALDEPENARKFAQNIYDNTKRVIELVNTQIDMMNLERGMVTFRFQDIYLYELIVSLETVFRNVLMEHNLRFFVNVPRDLQILVDQDQLRRVFINLIDNAIKATPDGGSITLTAERLGQRVLVSIADTGCGIPPEDILMIFQKHYKSRHSLPRPARGYGLGLSIANEIVKAHRGVIRVESDLGKGTCVKITLPQLPVEENEASELPEHVLADPVLPLV